MTSSIYADIARENIAFDKLARKFKYTRMDAIESNEDMEDAFGSGGMMEDCDQDAGVDEDIHMEDA